MNNCECAFQFNFEDDIYCDAYSQAKRKDGLSWAHYPECKPENCLLIHPELLDGATLEMEE